VISDGIQLLTLYADAEQTYQSISQSINQMKFV